MLTEEATDLVECDSCSEEEDPSTLTEIAGGDRVCVDCFEGYTSCDACSEHHMTHEMNVVSNGDTTVCDPCLRNDYFYCECCSEYHHDDDQNSTLSGESFCDSCREDHYSYCEDCEGYYSTEGEGDYHIHGGCACEAPGQSFAIRNDGEPALRNDELVTVTLPAGVISVEGVGAISRYLRDWSYANMNDDRQGRDKFYNLSYNLDQLGEQWQTKQGNYTKRLSRFAHKAYGLSLKPEVLSQVGCIARDHSTAVDFTLAVTRDLNMSAEEFGHGESCWWQSYAESRCALKNNGGFGLRTFTRYTWGNDVSGRAWVMPLREVERVVPLGVVWEEGESVPCNCGYKDCTLLLPGPGRAVTPEGPARLVKELVPTFDTETPDAFVVFNGYGALGGYAPARIMSHMAGMTYRKIEFSCSPMYVNSGGYLVAPEEIASRYDDGELHLETEAHADLHSTERVSVAA